MEYLSLQYQWCPEQLINLSLTIDRGKIVHVSSENEVLPLVARQLCGLKTSAEESEKISFISEELRLVQPLLSFDYLEQRSCPQWLVPLYSSIRSWPNKERCSTGYPEVDQLYQKYVHSSRYPILKSMLKIFSDQLDEKLQTIGFIDKMGPAAIIFLKHKINEPNARIKNKVQAAQRRFAKHYGKQDSA